MIEYLQYSTWSTLFYMYDVQGSNCQFYTYWLRLGDDESVSQYTVALSMNISESLRNVIITECAFSFSVGE